MKKKERRRGRHTNLPQTNKSNQDMIVVLSKNVHNTRLDNFLFQLVSILMEVHALYIDTKVNIK